MHAGDRLLHLTLGLLAMAFVSTMGGQHVSSVPGHDASIDRATVNLLRSAGSRRYTNAATSEASPGIAPAPYGLPAPMPAQPAREPPPLSLTLMLLFTCCGVSGVIGVIVIGAVLAAKTTKKDKSEERP